MEIISFDFEDRWAREFIEVAFRVYERDPRWIPVQRRSVAFQISGECPFFHYGRSRNFLALEGGRAVGRVSAILNPRAKEGPDQVGYLGFFECVDDADAAVELVGGATEWLRAEGASIVRGPVNYSTYYGNRMIISAEGHLPFLLEPYNPPTYPEFFRRAGFRIARKYLSYLADDWSRETHISAERKRKILDRGFCVRPFSMALAEEDLQALFEISERCFAGNWSYSPIPWEEFRAIYARVLSFVDPEMILFVISPEGKPVGFVFGYPDYGESVRRMAGRDGVAAKLRFFLAKGRADTVILKTLAVDSGYRDLRLGSLLAGELHDLVLRKGFGRIIYSTLMPGNESVSAMADRCSAVFREYAIFENV